MRRPAREIEQEVLSLERNASGAAGAKGGGRVSGPPLLLSHLIIPHMHEALGRMPGIDLEFIGETRDASLTRREADIALRLQRPTEPSITAKLLATIDVGLYGTAQYLAQTPEAEWAFIAYNDSLAHTPQQQWIEEIANRRRFALRANEMNAPCHAARAGIGLAALPHYLGRPDPGLVCVEGQVCSATRTLWLVMHDDVRRSRRVRAVADELLALFPRLTDEHGLL